MNGEQNAAARDVRPPDPGVLTIAAARHANAGRLAQACSLYQQLLAADPENWVALHRLGVVLHRLGHSDEAAGLIDRALALEPDNAAACSDLAAILKGLGRYDEAAKACRQAVALDPDSAASHNDLGDILLRQGHPAAAESAYARAADLHPGLAAAHAGRAEALAILGRLDEATAACDIALAHDPNLAQAHGAKGFILYKRHRHEDAIAACQDALRIDPGMALVHSRLGVIRHVQKDFEGALAAFERAVAAEPGCAEFHCNKALALQELGRLQEALDAYARALAVKPDFADVLTRLGILLHCMRRPDEALAALRKAVCLAPRNTAALLNLAGILKDYDLMAEAAETYRALLSVGNGPMAVAQFEYCHLRRHLCDWQGLEDAERSAIDGLKASGERVPPFGALAMACGPADHLTLARRWADGFKAAAPPASLSRPGLGPSAKRRIRLGYLSSDFHDHATSSLVTELFERHDSSRFELFAYCFGQDDQSAMRRRLMAAFDRFTILKDHSHADAARAIAGDAPDVLIDLKGYTRGARPAILAQRPAPVQVNYLGYPGTMGAAFIDYIIADPFVAPMQHQRYFDEKIVQLPDCYQPNDRQRRASPMPRTRKDFSLPDDGMVFCAFNSVYKITADVFSIWMRLLQRVPGGVLWLLDANPTAKANLRYEAALRDVDPDRLVFAPKLPIAEHLARYPFADIFLDNLPVNAHTTASEALWAGLPVVTCAGEIFVGRAAGSLLLACGLPDLVTGSLAEYEALALRLATDRALLAHFRSRLARDRSSARLFDIERYARNLEAAFVHMVRLHEAGRPPEAFAVADVI